MADLIADEHRRRAQIMLLAGFALATMFITLALILNSAIYTENLASRSEPTTGSGVVSFQQARLDDVGRLVGYVNRNNNSTRAALGGNLTSGVNAISNLTAQKQALYGHTTYLEVNETTNGTHLAQSDGTLYTDAGGNQDWTLATGVNRTRAFRLNVSESLTTASCSFFSSCFQVEVTDGTDEWKLEVQDSVTGIDVRIENGTGTYDCGTYDADQVLVDLTAGTINGTECAALDFAENVAQPYSIAYENGDEAGGDYSLYVDNETIATAPGPEFNTNTSPYARHAIYNTTAHVYWEHNRILYENYVTVAPGEPHD